jgi:putative ATP-dependent endonuclease of the OLD family
MYISRVVVRNFRNIRMLDVPLRKGVTSVVGENNTGKTNLLHAIRLVLDVDLPAYLRELTPSDVNEAVAAAHPLQVLVALEFREFEDDVNASAFAGYAKVEENLARLTYRFRPSAAARTQLAEGALRPEGLTYEHYRWEISGGGTHDPATITWDTDTGQSIRYSDLADYLVVFLHALRDVAADLKASRTSPLRRLLRALDIPKAEQDALVAVLTDANTRISGTDTIRSIGGMLHTRLGATAGEAFAHGVRLGMTSATFASIERNLAVLLSGRTHSSFDPSQNGLGLNNILYVAILLQYFETRAERAESAGNLLLIEEPEAHLHSQLQRVLYGTMVSEGVQTIVTTHSTHITAAGHIDDLVVLSIGEDGQVHGHRPSENAGLDASDKADLDRYLDATKSTLLFARRVILVEGPAEMFLVPAFALAVLDIDLDRHGVAVVPIFGTHFAPYARLFGPDAIRKRCAIITDRDEPPGDPDETDLGVLPRNLGGLENDLVKVFSCPTTLERELAVDGMLGALRATAAELNIRSLTAALDARPVDHAAIGARVLAAAKAHSKGRFAQVLARHADQIESCPDYIRDAIRWVTQ